jgi:hypothetical protein
MTRAAGLQMRAERMFYLGPMPPWWRPFARRKWRRERDAIMAIDVSAFGDMLRSVYQPRDIEEAATSMSGLAMSMLRKKP